ncbi:MAG: PP2C family protein-serine/threonine phosphatase [Candidatus Riflebacteria bacterium]|nr:PP2C family protein-serine/threonine phosphatase [Candidatus Riflebacteria bacterium]
MEVFKDKFWLVVVVAFLITFQGIFFSEEEKNFSKSDSGYLENVENTFDSLFLNIEGNSDPCRFFEKILFKLKNAWLSDTNGNALIKRAVTRLKKRFPGVFEFSFVNRDGNVIPELCDFPPPKVMIKKFFLDYRSFLSGKSALPERQKTFIQGFLGKFVPFNQQIHNRVLFATEGFRKRYVFISRPSSKGCFIVHLNQVDDWNLLTLRDIIKQFQKKRTSFKLGFFDNDSKTFFPPLGVYCVNKEVKNLLTEMSDEKGKAIVRGRYVYSAKLISPRICLVAGKAVPDSYFEKKRLLHITAICVLAILLVIFASLYHYREYFLKMLTIRNKLMIIFAASAGIPLLIVVFNAFSFLMDKRQIIESEVFSQVAVGLNKFDGGLQAFIKDIGKELSSELESLQKSTRQDSIKEDLEKLVSRNEISYIRLFDRKGKLVFRKEGNMGVSAFESLFLDFGPSVVKMFKQIDSGEAIVGKRVSLETAKRKKGQIDEGNLLLSMITSNIGSASLMEMENLKIVTFTYLLRDQAGQPSHFVFIFWEKKQIENLYLKKHLLKLWRDIPQTRVWAVWGNELENKLPPAKKWPKTMIQFVNSLGVGGSVRTQIQKEPKGEVLLTGFRCKALEDRFLIARTSDSMIRRELGVIKYQILGIIFFIAFFSISSAIFLAQRFLNPASRLKVGIEMLRSRNFNFRSEVVGSGEWKELLTTFNQIMEGMKELEVAKVLQDGFFPSSSLDLTNWRIHGVCIPTMQVGGDYFDYVPVKDNKALILVGDVSGHGVSAALVVAMAKAILSHPLTPLNPKETLEILNYLFFKTLRRKKNMTCVACLLDATAGTITVSNAGQSFPLIIRNDKVIEVELPSFPLGVKKTTKLEIAEFVLQPDDILIFYTDGIVEYPDQEGKMIGYERFFSDISKRVGKTPLETVKNTMVWLESIVKNSPQRDDITLVVCQKL